MKKKRIYIIGANHINRLPDLIEDDAELEMEAKPLSFFFGARLISIAAIENDVVCIIDDEDRKKIEEYIRRGIDKETLECRSEVETLRPFDEVFIYFPDRQIFIRLYVLEKHYGW